MFNFIVQFAKVFFLNPMAITEQNVPSVKDNDDDESANCLLLSV